MLPSEFLVRPSLQGCWILFSCSSSTKIWFFEVNLFYFLRWISELKWVYTDFPSDIHLICAYCKSAGRRFLSAAAAARACCQNHLFSIPDFFVFLLDAVNAEALGWKMPLKQKMNRLRLLLDVCAAHSIARWLNKMAECWDSRHLLSAASSPSSFNSQFK